MHPAEFLDALCRAVVFGAIPRHPTNIPSIANKQCPKDDTADVHSTATVHRINTALAWSRLSTVLCQTETHKRHETHNEPLTAQLTTVFQRI